ncbi:hypothetical protein Vadar_023782 [Vaccinium darrowii]|uniref:Uncharacterized protein n=1 Tax=Vaccinium darrowii TaxID=229202 RepID=A0ACB7YYQ0_9ERIC|nr:hypothetical protein Vadar_023782 [Vaccinium darrowii]
MVLPLSSLSHHKSATTTTSSRPSKLEFHVHDFISTEARTNHMAQFTLVSNNWFCMLTQCRLQPALLFNCRLDKLWSRGIQNLHSLKQGKEDVDLSAPKAPRHEHWVIFMLRPVWSCPLGLRAPKEDQPVSFRTATAKGGYDPMQGQALNGGNRGEWHDYQYADQLAYPEQYLQQNIGNYDVQTGLNIQRDAHPMTQEEKDRGLGSAFKRDDQSLQQLRERDLREKDPNFISDSYSECYPGYQEYNREVVDSDDDVQNGYAWTDASKEFFEHVAVHCIAGKSVL